MTYQPQLQNILEAGSIFANELKHELLAEGFPLDLVSDKEKDGHYICAFDHLCLRVETEEAYAKWKSIFENNSGIIQLKETMVGGRNIAVYKLPSPFGDAPYPMYEVIELPAPKEGSPYSEGWEHAEIALNGTQFEGSFEAFLKAFPQFKERWSLGGYNKESNPDLALKLRSGKTIKFHVDTLEKVIENEARMT